MLSCFDYLLFNRGFLINGSKGYTAKTKLCTLTMEKYGGWKRFNGSGHSAMGALVNTSLTYLRSIQKFPHPRDHKISWISAIHMQYKSLQIATKHAFHLITGIMQHD
jgi:hypothetical protein